MRLLQRWHICIAPCGVLLIILGIFVPLVVGFSHGKQIWEMSQWNVFIDALPYLTEAWLLCLGIVLSLLIFSVVLLMGFVSLLFPRFSPRLILWRRDLTLTGALLQFLITVPLFFLSRLSGAEVFPGVGFALLLMSFILVFWGIHREQREEGSTNTASTTIS